MKYAPIPLGEPRRVDQAVVGVGHPRGDCLRACLASLSGLPLEAVIDTTDPTLENAWMRHLEVWADERGFALESHETPPEGWSIMAGTTSRGPDLHAVIGFDGEVWHDPHPSREGLATTRWALTLNRKDG